MVTKITNGKFILPSGIQENVCTYFKDGKIITITDKEHGFDREVNANGQYISPGFIDMHVHGGGGYDFMDGGTQPIINAAAFHAKHGTTSLLASTLACSTTVLIDFLHDLQRVLDNHSAPNIVGAHLEGPYFSLEYCGAQNTDYIKDPPPEEYKMLFDIGKKIIKRWSFAPELEGASDFCKFLVDNKIIPSIGHSSATYNDVKKVYDIGCRLFTHFYSCMSTITRNKGFRSLGVIESAYLLDNVQIEIIADGKHLPPELLRLAVKLFGTENISLVTDAMRGAGMPNGESSLGRKGETTPCIIEDGVAKLCDRSAFAGSVATVDRLVRTMVDQANVSIYDAVKMMSTNPAKILGFLNKGSLKDGYDADIVLFDENISVSKVFIGGNEI